MNSRELKYAMVNEASPEKAMQFRDSSVDVDVPSLHTGCSITRWTLSNQAYLVRKWRNDQPEAG